jgi:aromatic ring-opening dioxygenase catalytic subunit (LigB family)
MAELVAVLGVPHNPLLYLTMRDPIPDDLVATSQMYGTFANRLAELEVDSVVVVGSDHLRKFTHDNSPAFVVGKASRFATTYENEQRHFGLDSWEVKGDEELAARLLNGATDIDLALSNEWVLDHAFAVPLRFLRPGWDLPVVPVHTNTNIPPIPRAARFARLGTHIADTVAAAPIVRRIAVVATGHLATDIGGPKGFLGGASPDPEFDSEAVEWMRSGDLAGAIAGCNFPRLVEAGNVTPQFLNFVTALAATGGRPADVAEGVASRFAAGPFFFWEPE